MFAELQYGTGKMKTEKREHKGKPENQRLLKPVFASVWIYAVTF